MTQNLPTPKTCLNTYSHCAKVWPASVMHSGNAPEGFGAALGGALLAGALLAGAFEAGPFEAGPLPGAPLPPDAHAADVAMRSGMSSSLASAEEAAVVGGPRGGGGSG